MADETTLYEDAILDYNGLKTYDSWIKKYITDYAYSKSAVDSTLTNYYKKNETYSQTEINDKLSTKPPSEHASAYTGYGAGTTNYYGHVKLINGDVSSKKLTDGEAAAAAHNHDGHHSKTDHTHSLSGNKITGILPLSKGGTGISATSNKGLLNNLGLYTIQDNSILVKPGENNITLQCQLDVNQIYSMSATYLNTPADTLMYLSPIGIKLEEQNNTVILHIYNRHNTNSYYINYSVSLWA